MLAFFRYLKRKMKEGEGEREGERELFFNPKRKVNLG